MWQRDSIIVFAAVIIFTALAASMDLFESFHALLTMNEAWEIDELAFGLFALMVGMWWFTTRRLGELKQLSAQYQHELMQTRKLASVIEQMSDGVVISDTTGKPEFANASFTKMTGYTLQDLLESNLETISSRENIGLANMGSKKSWSDKIITLRKDGSMFPCYFSQSPILDEKDNITHFAAIYDDIEDYEDLEQQFFQAQKMEATGAMVSGIAHDFNNSLTGITGNLHLIKRLSTDQPEVLKRASIVEKLSYDASTMINTLLNFSSADDKRIEVLDIEQFIDDALKLIQPTIPENITVNFRRSTDKKAIEGNHALLLQLFINLIYNARDALLNCHQPTIEIRTEIIKHQKGDTVCFYIRDNGPGIPIEHLGKIKTAFFTTKETGTGLGLAMVQKALNSMSGTFDIQNHPSGKGAVATVCLPLTTNAHLQSDAQPQLQRGLGEKILVVDDAPEIRDILEQILSGLNYQVYTAENGQQAIETFQDSGPYDLVIMDMVMPVMDGIDAYLAIKHQAPTCEIVFLSGYQANLTEAHEAILAKETLLSKPAHPEELSMVIHQKLKNKKVTD